MRRDAAILQQGPLVYANRLTAQVDGLQKKLLEGAIDHQELPGHFLNLSRSIDHAVASNQKPTEIKMILNSFKLFAQHKDDDILFPSMMVLMLSMKSACLAGWFKQSESDELLLSLTALFDYSKLNGDCWKAQSSRFAGSPSIEHPNAEAFIPNICSRYYPRLTPMAVIVALTVKPGYEARGCDFQITSQLSQSTKLRLFVCKMDNLDNSACLVTPPLLSFLLNGKGVERRMFLSTPGEAGPQLPSDITQLLRIGCNFLQIIGDCTDTYFVAIASVRSMTWTSSSVKLPDYILPISAGDSDDEVIVGSSRISLRCPLSHLRIKTAVKGVSCKHHQAFDYDSYMEINERRPAWRCPCCHAYVNCLELRFDQQMDKILKEVDEKVYDVIINQDGTWAADAAEVGTDDSPIQDNGESAISDNAVGRSEGLPNGVIALSDDEDDRPAQTGTGAKEQGHARGSLSGTNDFDVDRKPDIRSMYIGETSAGTESLNVPAPTAGSHRDVLAPSPVMNALHSSLAEVPDQQRQANLTSGRSSQDTPGGMRNHVMQNHGGTLSSWGVSNNLSYASSPPLGGQSSEHRSADRPVYLPTGRSTVIQALPAASQYSNLMGRTRIMSTSSNSNLSAVTAGLSTASLQSFEVRPGQQQVQNSELSEIRLQDLRPHIYSANSARNQTQLDGTHRSQRLPQRTLLQSTAGQNGQVRDGQGHQQYQYGSPGAYQGVHGQQNSNQAGQQHQYPTSATQQTSARQLSEIRGRNALALQQAVQSSMQRGSTGAGTSSVHGAASAGSQPVLVRQGGSHPSYAGITNPVSNPVPVAASSSSPLEGWIPPPQLTNWRPAGTPRMRGAVLAGSAPMFNPGTPARSSTTSGLPSSLNRTRMSPNVIQMAPAPVFNASATSSTSNWGGRANSAVGGIGSGELYNVPGSVSPSTLLPEMSWAPLPSTGSESNTGFQVLDNTGFQDTFWIDDNLFMPGSPGNN